MLNDTGGLAVGDAAAGMMSVSAGGTVDAGYSIIGNQAGITGNATVGGTGAAWITSGALTIGNGGNGTLAVNAGGRVSAQIVELAAVAGVTGSATISGAAASVAATQVVDVGYAGTAHDAGAERRDIIGHRPGRSRGAGRRQRNRHGYRRGVDLEGRDLPARRQCRDRCAVGHQRWHRHRPEPGRRLSCREATAR